MVLIFSEFQLIIPGGIMKFLILFVTSILVSLPASGQASLEERVIQLEARMESLETALKTKLSHCKLSYKHHAYRLNLCDKGTFARSFQDVGNGATQLECGYYQLVCGREPIAGQ